MEQCCPVYLLKGDDPGLVGQALQTLMREQAPDGAGVEEIAEDASASAVLDACLTPAFLTPRRVVLVKGAGRFKADEAALIADYLAAPMTSTVLVLVSGGGAIPQKLNKAVKDHGHVIDASTPSGKGRTAWVQAQVKKGPIKVSGDGMSLLLDRLGDDLSQLEGVLDALAAAKGEGASVSGEELLPFLGSGGAGAPWELTDAIDSGDVLGALTQLRRMLEGGGRHPLVVMATLAKHVTQLVRLDGSDVTSEAEAAALLGVAPYPAKKAMIQSRRLGSRSTARAAQLVAQADADLRGASAWPSPLVLEVLVARLCRLSPSPAKKGQTARSRPSSSKKSA